MKWLKQPADKLALFFCLERPLKKPPGRWCSTGSKRI